MACTITPKTKSQPKFIYMKSIVGENVATESYANNNEFAMEFTDTGARSDLYYDILNYTGSVVETLYLRSKFLSSEFQIENKAALDALTPEDKYGPDGEVKFIVLRNILDNKNKNTVSNYATKIKDGFMKMVGKTRVLSDPTENVSIPEDKTQLTRYVKFLEYKMSNILQFLSRHERTPELIKDVNSIKSNIEKIKLAQDPLDKHYIYTDLLIDSAKVFKDEGHRVLRSLNDFLANNPKPGIEFNKQLKKFYHYNTSFSFILKSLQQYTSSTAANSGSNKDVIINDFKQDIDLLVKEFSLLEEKIQLEAVKMAVNVIEFSDIATSNLIDSDTGELVMQKRDNDYNSQLFRRFQSYFQDLSMQANNMLQLMGNFAGYLDTYYTNRVNDLLSNIKKKFEIYNEKLGTDYSIFYDTEINSKGEEIKVNRLVSPDYTQTEQYRKVFKPYWASEYSKRNTASGLLSIFQEIFDYWDDKFVFHDPLNTNNEDQLTKNNYWNEAFLSTVEKFSKTKDTVTRDILYKQLTELLRFNPAIVYSMYKNKDASGKTKVDTSQMTDMDAILDSYFNKYGISSVYNIQDGNGVKFYNSKIAIQSTYGSMMPIDQHTIYRFDTFIKTQTNEKNENKNWIKFRDTYLNKPEYKFVSDLYYDILKLQVINNEMMPNKTMSGRKVNKFDLFETSKSLKEDLTESGLFYYAIDSLKDVITDFYQESSQSPSFRVYNYETGEYEYKLRKPAQKDKPYSEVSHDLFHVLAQHTKIAHAFKTKAEIEPFTKMVESYANEAQVIENGKVVTRKLEEELTAVKAFKNQMLYNASNDSKNQAKEKYLTNEQMVDYKKLTEELKIINNELELAIKKRDLNAYTDAEQKKKAVLMEIESILQTAKGTSFAKIVLSVTGLARLVSMGFKVGSAIVDMMTGMKDNLTQATTHRYFTRSQYLKNFFTVLTTYAFPINTKKINVLMEYNKVQLRINEFNAESDHRNQNLKELTSRMIRDPQVTLANATPSNLGFSYYKVSGYLNVIPIMISMLENKMITVEDASGNSMEVSIWDSFNDEGDFIYDEKFNPYYKDESTTSFGAKVSFEINDIIHKTHGNISNKRTAPIYDTLVGKMMMPFRNWIPNKISELYSPEQFFMTEEDYKSGQVNLAAKQIKKAFQSKEEFIETAMLVLFSPYYNTVQKRILRNDKTFKLNNTNQVNSDQLVKFVTKIHMLAIMTILYSMMFDPDDDELYYNEETNMYEKKKQPKINIEDMTYLDLGKNYSTNLARRLLNENSVFTAFGVISEDPFPVMGYLGRSYDLIDFWNMKNGRLETTIDDRYDVAGDEIGGLKMVDKLAKVTPLLNGFFTDWEWAHDKNYYKGSL